MSSAKDIKRRIDSVTDTQKITNAMYLIASTKLRKARNDLNNTQPYFEALKGELERIFRTIDHVNSQYFLPEGVEDDDDAPVIEGKYAYLIITADKGLAGAYNQNIVKEAARIIDKRKENVIYVVGEYGRAYFLKHNYPVDESFHYAAQSPTMDVAREIGAVLIDSFLNNEIKKVYIIYTDFGNGFEPKTLSFRLLPVHRSYFRGQEEQRTADGDDIEYFPSMEEVLDNVLPNYLIGYIYSALVDSYCSEQNARMMAMERATDNAQDILDKLNLEYNHVRQSAITQEIIEVSAGAKSLKKNKAHFKQEENL
ncbi:MAG: ATP synthase F1 subunit gamma [Lachnospiraceae bacterium]|nr:ATP synthase F1 subunit gamma [Lachnospiraceae bacterium]